MLKKLLIIIIIVALLGIGAWFYFQNLPTQNNSGITGNVASGTLPAISVVALPTSTMLADMVAIGTSKGTVVVKNFYRTGVGRDEEYLYFESSSAYSLLYDTIDSSFVVSISGGPLSETRSVAEGALLSALGVNQTDACKLTVVVGVSSDVDPSLAHRALPLSFCD